MIREESFVRRLLLASQRFLAPNNGKSLPAVAPGGIPELDLL